MNKLVSSLLLLLVGCLSLQAQKSPLSIEPNEKFGKPTAEEWELTTYAPNPEANAVVLYSNTLAKYDYTGQVVRIIYEYKKRIKILKEEGATLNYVDIPYYKAEKEKTDTPKEEVKEIKATVFNRENGKVVRMRIKKEEITEERVNAEEMRLRINLPDVKAGSIIEYEYELHSDLYYKIRTWMAQEEIPTIYTRYCFSTPKFFLFNIKQQGYEHLEHTQKPADFAFMLEDYNTEQWSGMSYIYEGREMPAMKGESHTWYPKDYYTQVHIELLTSDIPRRLERRYTQTWHDIDLLLEDRDDFGLLLGMRNPLYKEMEALPLDQAKSTEEKVELIFRLLKSRLQWNGKYTLYGRSAQKVLEEGAGSNADLNFILISMLKDAGINAYPVTMSHRTCPRLSKDYPTLQGLNTFVVGIALSANNIAYLDASVTDGALNLLPPTLLTDQARLKTPNGEMWVNLQHIAASNTLRGSFIASISPDGLISGTRTMRYQGQPTTRVRADYHSAKDSADYINRLGSRLGIQIQSYESTELDAFTNKATEKMTFTKQAEKEGDYIRINPLVFPHCTEAPFTQAARRLPVEFGHTEQVEYIINLTLPDGYTVEKMPEVRKLNGFEGAITMTYNIAQQENRINLRYIFQLKNIFYAPDNYPDLKAFWEKLAEANKAMLVLKKTN